MYLYNATSGYGNYQYSRSYSYGNTWSDQLTSYNGSSISYDNAGNPTSYLGGTMSWTRGRLLSSYKPSGATYTTTCSYNADGIRRSKTTPVSSYVGRTTSYTLSGTTILQETRTTAGPSSSSSVTLTYLYDHSGIIGFIYDGEVYKYVKDILGDITHICSSTNGTVAQYTYDAWGNHTVCDGSGNDASSDSTNVGNINPFVTVATTTIPTLTYTISIAGTTILIQVVLSMLIM